MRTWCTVIVFVLLVILASILTIVHWIVSVVFLLLTTGLFVRNGIKVVPANPPHKGILTFLGKRQEVALNEGWNWLPLYSFIFNFILIKVEKVNYDPESQQVRTPDRAVISVLPSITWKPGIQGRPDSFISYLNSGGEAGVKKIIHDIIEDRVKTWASSNREGPSTWTEAQALKDDAHEVLVKALLGKTLEPIRSEVPTNTWMRFFDKPQSEPTSYDANQKNGWAYKNPETGDWNWNGLQDYYEKLSEDERKRIYDAVEKRRDDVRNIREGKGEFGEESLGITIIRFTINEVKVEGEVAKAAELEEKERREKQADTVEIDNFSQRATSLMKAHPGLSSEQALDVTQVILGKVSKKIVQVVGAQTGLGQDVLGALSLGSLGGVSNNPSGSKKENQQEIGERKEGKNKKFDKKDEDDLKELADAEEMELKHIKNT